MARHECRIVVKVNRRQHNQIHEWETYMSPDDRLGIKNPLELGGLSLYV